MTPSEFFKLPTTRLKEIAVELNELNEHKEKNLASNEELLIFAKSKYKNREYLFAVNYCGYLRGINVMKIEINQLLEMHLKMMK